MGEEAQFWKRALTGSGWEFCDPGGKKPQVSHGRTERFSAVSIDRENVILDTMKPAEDGSGDIVLRLYESKKSATSAKVRCAFGSRAYLCDMLENVLEEVPYEAGEMALAFKAFEVKTIRIKK